MTVSNRLGITELAETQNNRSVTINEAIAKLEAGATFFAAIQVLLNTPPGSPAEGDLYVVGTAGTGAWSGHNNNVTIYYNAAWLFFSPIEGMFAWDQTSDTLKRYSGSAWVAYTVGSGAIADGDYGDVTVSSTGAVWTIDNDVVTNAKSANMAESTIKGRAAGAGTGDPTDLTATQATAILDAMVGDSGSGGTKGLAPAPASGDAAASKFLKADGTWAVPAGTGVSSSRQVISGGGLTGGGDLSADRTLVVGAGTGITVNADDVQIATAYQAIGKQTIWIPASAMSAATTNGPATGQVETSSNKVNFAVLDFDATTAEQAWFDIAMPKGWDESTVTFQAWWTTSATDTDGIAISLAGVALSDNEALDTAVGTPVVVTDDAQSGALELLVTAESSAVTIAGSPAEGDLCLFRVQRVVSDGNDDMSEDMRLIGIKLFYTTNAANDA